MIRKSHYTLTIDTGDGNCLVLNQPRGLLDLMPAEYAAFLDHEPDQIPADLRDYALEAGYLTTLTPAAEDAWFLDLVEELESEQSKLRQSPLFSFITTFSCNLSCSYCFQANTEVRSAPRKFMSVEVARECLAVVREAPRHPERSVIELFGGEPLLPNLREVVSVITLEAEAMGYVVRATSNGTHLDAFEDLLGPSRIAELQISLDGVAEVHDTRRIPTNGEPTFDRIWANIQLALRKGVRVLVRANLDRRNLSRFAELVEFLDAEGFLALPNGELHYVDVQSDPIAPDYGLDASVPLAEIERYLREQARDRPVLNKLAAPPEIGDFHTWVDRNFRHPQTRHCGAVTNNLYFAPDRRIYTCHETAGREELATGEVIDGRIVENATAENWRLRRVDNLPGCRRCPFALTCSGGCAARTPILTEPDRSYCNGFESTFRELILRQYHASGLGVRTTEPENKSTDREGGEK